MVWKQFTGYDNSQDIILSVQNGSIIPFSKVYISVTSKTSAEPDTAIVLTGPNRWTQRVPAGMNVFYAEEDGGRFAKWYHYIMALVNYDIPFESHSVVEPSTTIIGLEGSYVTIQNKSVNPIQIRLGDGEGTLTLTELQAWSWTFAKDTNIKVTGIENITWVRGQSPNVTMLSDEMRQYIEDINAKVEGLLESAVTQEQLDIVHQRTYFGFWSELLEVSGSNTSEVTSATYEADKSYGSGFPSGRTVLDVVADISYTRSPENKEVNDISGKGNIYLSLLLEELGDTHQVLNFYTDDSWIKFNVKGFEVRRDLTNKRLFIKIKFKSNLKTFSARISIKADDTKWVLKTSDNFLAEKVCSYVIDKDNTDINFTDDRFYMNMLNLFRYPLNLRVIEKNVSSITSSNQSGETVFNFTLSDNYTIKATFRDDGANANIFVTVEASQGVSRVIGLNFKDKNAPFSFDDLYLDLITMGNGDQIKGSEGSNDKVTIPLWKHTLMSYSYISEKLRNLVGKTKYKVEIIVE